MEIEILYDGQREMREAFTVHMKPDDNMVAEIQVRRTSGHARSGINQGAGPARSRYSAAHPHT